ncbi:MAG: DNA polymerase III subunit delta [Clostridiales bacterium]|nr:DNA polymerase III subunit delta [Clostridiales bacterium]
MKFEELKKSLVNSKSYNYLLEGKDMFLLDNAYRLIYESLHIEMPELNEIKFKDVEIDFNLVVSSLNTPAVFSDSKVVYVDLSSKYVKVKNIDLLKEYLSEKEFYNVLVIRVADNADALKGVNTSIFEDVDCNSISREVAIKLLAIEAKKYGKNIASDAINNLLEYTNSDLATCMNEINKLANYSQGDITVKDVDAIVTKTLDYKIYELTEALAKKNVAKVYEILTDLKHKKNGYMGLIGLIYTHFRRLLHVSITKLSIAEYADLFGIKEYPVKKCIEQSRSFKPKKLKEINDMCTKLEYQVKTSQITPINAVDMLVLEILK